MHKKNFMMNEKTSVQKFRPRDLDPADDIGLYRKDSSTSTSRTTTDKFKSIFQICPSAKSLDWFSIFVFFKRVLNT